ncbi:MAG: alpha-glucan phosphorylase [Planctomycetaceae bacterium]|nr:MAG: alpha-glucan phosphorylase [Planctomycetaceae bacterium]
MTVMDRLSFAEKLHALARNYWWSWHPEVMSIFQELNPQRWRQLDHNPVLLLDEYTPEQLEQRGREMVLHSRVNYAYRRWQEYMQGNDTWGATHAGVLGHRPVAYFSAEFGIHESLPNYSGGLGVLAGDHLKSASDLGIPLVAIGLFYHEGYFSQLIDENGWQQEVYAHVENSKLPIKIARLPSGEPVVVRVDTRQGPLFAQAWQVDVGRIKLFLLDVNIDQNQPEDRKLTARLYGGDQRTRIRQEIVLGLGGARVLTALGYRPHVIHMNEGHSAFAPLEFIRLKMQEDGLSFEDALREVAARCVFTTHTPVPAGHDRFDWGLIEEHLGPTADQLGIGVPGLMALGRVDPNNHGEPFCMTVLAFKCSRRANAVSNLHGVVSRRMWACLWPWRSEEEVPIGHITNGVHVGSWLAPQMRLLYDRVLPVGWEVRTAEPDTWRGFEQITPGELWETHQALKNRLISFARERLIRRGRRLQATDSELAELQNILDPEALTIGFARRFAPYKRADLLLRDIETLGRIVSDSKHPVQFIFAGKAHPADNGGKAILQRIYRLTQEPPFRGRIVLLEDYDINLARHLVQGVDVWLNNPRRPLEASGTSGQKVVLNGGLNCSILDGWWAEAFDGRNGFAIGNGQTHTQQDVQDERDARALMDVLLHEVIPLFYDRNPIDELPDGWIARMKRSVRTLGWRFNSDRMVMDYVQHAYLPAAGGTSCEMMRLP